MKNKILMVMILGMFLFSLSPIIALDDQGTGKQGQNFTLVQVCNYATFITIGTIQLPDRTTLIVDENMTFIAAGTYSVLFPKYKKEQVNNIRTNIRPITIKLCDVSKACPDGVIVIKNEKVFSQPLEMPVTSYLPSCEVFVKL